ncbi:hypothetical protein FB451DRAFT_1258011 [Mycena latifolia]|nr:hypothetical protein FB451DRAFT_1258011 [Mycena latifolia]
MPRILPQELLDTIVDELSNDIPALEACSLAARAFSRSTRIYIFSTIHLFPASGARGAIGRKNHCQKFEKLLTSAPHLAPLVKDLRIVEGMSSDVQWRDEELSGRKPGIPWVVTSARTLISLLPRLTLRRISFLCKDGISFNWDRLPQRLRATLHDVFRSPALESVHLLGITTSHPQHIIVMLSTAPKLKELVWEYWHPDFRGPVNIDIPREWQPRLQHLAFSDHYTNAQLSIAFTSSTVDFSGLKTLSVSGLDQPRIQPLLKTLTALENLNIWYPMSLTLIRSDIEILSLTRLRSLRVSGHLTVGALATIVTNCVAHTSLEEILLESNGLSITSQSEQWMSFCAAVRKFEPAKRLEIVLCGHKQEEYKKHLERSIGLLSSQGLVSLKTQHRFSTLSSYTSPYM